MARTPNNTPLPADLPALNDETVRADLMAADQMAAGDLKVMQYEEITRQLGQIDSMEFMRRVADVAQAQIFERVRKSGAYKGYPYRDGENLRHVASIEEFCEVKLGKSYRRCMDLSQNLRVLGPELYEQSERLGLRNVDYKTLRALPADDQVLIKQAIEEATSRDDVLDILQEMAVRHAQEKEALAKEAAEAKADYAALDEVEKTTREQLSNLQRENAKLLRVTDMWDTKVLGVTDEIGKIGTVGDEVIGKHLSFIQVCEVLADNLDRDAADYLDKLEQARVPIARLNDQIERYAHVIARLRFEFETRLSGYLDNSHILTPEDAE